MSNSCSIRCLEYVKEVFVVHAYPRTEVKYILHCCPSSGHTKEKTWFVFEFVNSCMALLSWDHIRPAYRPFTALGEKVRDPPGD